MTKILSTCIHRLAGVCKIHDEIMIYRDGNLRIVESASKRYEGVSLENVCERAISDVGEPCEQQGCIALVGISDDHLVIELEKLIQQGRVIRIIFTGSYSLEISTQGVKGPIRSGPKLRELLESLFE